MPKKKTKKEDININPAKKSKVSKRFISILIILLSAILVIIIPLLLIQIGLIKNPLNYLPSSPELFTIEDKCSLIVGQLIHNIGDEDSCQQICKSNCEVREMQFYSSEFEKKEEDCNKCNCYCE